MWWQITGIIRLSMNKTILDNKTFISPMPALLIGSLVDGNPNFMTAAWTGIATAEPPMITIGIEPERYTYKGILQNMAFSVNVPSADLVEEVDLCGRESGNITDKVKVCKFQVFYGEIETAPLIEQCPVNLECRVVHILNVGSYSLVIGQIEQAHVSKNCLTNGLPDVLKVDPIVFAPGENNNLYYNNFYYNIGKQIFKSNTNSTGEKPDKR